MFLGGALLLSAVTTVVMTWWFRPIENLHDETGHPFGPFEPNAFALRGIVPIAGALLAFAIGAAAGTFFRRGLVAIVVTVVAYLPVLALLPALRAHYRPARTVSYPFRTPSPRAGYRDWVLGHDLVDKAGQAAQRIQVPDECRALAVRARTPAWPGPATTSSTPTSRSAASGRSSSSSRVCWSPCPRCCSARPPGGSPGNWPEHAIILA